MRVPLPLLDMEFFNKFRCSRGSFFFTEFCVSNKSAADGLDDSYVD